MALLKCPDCGHDVSSLAPSCVNCGRPMGASDPPETCEVILRRISGLGLFSGARWVLEAQVMEFHRAREAITNQLLRAGWQPVGSVSDGAGMSLPRFQRPPGRG